MKINLTRGVIMGFAIGIENTKIEMNIGTLWRSAYNFKASMIFTIGKRYKKQCSDTQKTWKKIPLMHYTDWEDFKNHTPYDWVPIGIELTKDAICLSEFKHPRMAIYILGAEDNGLSKEAMSLKNKVYIPTTRPQSINVAVAGSIVMYDRYIKSISNK